MLRAFTEYIIALLELLQAEGRSLRKGLYEIGLSLILVSVAGAVLLAALALLVWALFLALAPIVPQAVAVLICGLVLLLIAGGLLWNARLRAA